MKLLNTRYMGMIARCNACGAIIGYNPEDVSASQNISCPQCRFSIWVPFNPNYDGVIKEDANSNEKSGMDNDGIQPTTNGNELHSDTQQGDSGEGASGAK